MKKYCRICDSEKDISEFGLRKRKYKDGIKMVPNSTCKECNRKISKQYYYKSKNKNIRYVYRFLNKDNEVIYVGKTESLINRISNHFSVDTHLPKSCIEETYKIQYIAMTSSVLMDIREIYYINLYKPLYNSNYLVDEAEFVLAEFVTDKWVDFDKEEVKNINRDLLIDGIYSVFVRKRNIKYLVYVEIVKDGKKKHILKGSFYDEQDAIKLKEKIIELNKNSVKYKKHD